MRGSIQVPEGYACVEEGLYRAMTIKRHNMDFLETLELRTIISRNPELPSSSLKQFCESHSIDLVHVGLQPWASSSDWWPMKKSILQETISFAFNETKYPLLVVEHANLFMESIRRMQHWTFSSILAEYTAFSGVRANYKVAVRLEMVELTLIPHEEAYPPGNEALGRHLELAEKKHDDASSDTILILPPESVLPEWFKRGQAMWAEDEKELQRLATQGS